MNKLKLFLTAFILSFALLFSANLVSAQNTINVTIRGRIFEEGSFGYYPLGIPVKVEREDSNGNRTLLGEGVTHNATGPDFLGILFEIPVTVPSNGFTIIVRPLTNHQDSRSPYVAYRYQYTHERVYDKEASGFIYLNDGDSFFAGTWGGVTDVSLFPPVDYLYTRDGGGGCPYPNDTVINGSVVTYENSQIPAIGATVVAISSATGQTTTTTTNSFGNFVLSGLTPCEDYTYYVDENVPLSDGRWLVPDGTRVVENVAGFNNKDRGLNIGSSIYSLD